VANLWVVLMAFLKSLFRGDSSKPKLRWYQYSLRTLFVFMTLCAVACSWLAVKMRQAKKQQEAVEAIQKVGGSVTYDYVYAGKPNPQPPPWLRELFSDDFFATVACVDFDNTQVTDAGLEKLKGLTQLQALFLENTQVTDAGLESLKGLTQLKLLSLDNTQVTDAGLENLKGLTQFQALALDNTQVTDAGLENLKGLTQLDGLSLDNTQVTDAGLENLKGLTQLVLLSLNNTQVTDAGLEKLKGLTQLLDLSLDNTQVTDEGVSKLQQALLKCKISR
jgi:Leucine-rich repeat (LRR) protein